MAKKIAVVLSGCGNQDGAEITESVSTLLALSECDANYQLYAPDMSFSAKNFLTGKPSGETRNVLQESARIARGQIRALAELDPADFDAVIFPGGFGAALNLCNWGEAGAQCHVQPDVERVIQEFYRLEKPIGAICIAPALIARVLGHRGVTVTLGKESGASAEVLKTGAHHEVCAVDDFITDRENRIVSTPAYMYDGAKPFAVYSGIRRAVREIIEMA